MATCIYRVQFAEKTEIHLKNFPNRTNSSSPGYIKNFQRNKEAKKISLFDLAIRETTNTITSRLDTQLSDSDRIFHLSWDYTIDGCCGTRKSTQLNRLAEREIKFAIGTLRRSRFAVCRQTIDA